MVSEQIKRSATRNTSSIKLSLKWNVLIIWLLIISALQFTWSNGLIRHLVLTINELECWFSCSRGNVQIASKWRRTFNGINLDLKYYKTFLGPTKKILVVTIYNDFLSNVTQANIWVRSRCTVFLSSLCT